MDSDIEMCTPPDITEAAKTASASLLPQKSKEIYENTYNKFMNWRSKNNIKTFSENVILAYLSELAKNVKSSTLWSHYSMLKNTINIKNNIDIGKYPKVRAFLKRKNEGYIPQKSRVLEKEHIFKFINEAPDEVFLLTKVILIFGIAGALRRNEIYKLKMCDIQDLGNVLVVSVPDTKTKITRKFTITEHLELYRKYAALRPQNYQEDRFFIKYQGGKCTRQVVGINKFGKLPSEIAKFLKLPHPEKYTGHCFRRSSASLLVETGADLLMLKQHGGWKSSAVAEGYVENSLNKKNDISNRLLSVQNTNIASTTSSNIINKSSSGEATEVKFSNLTNCNITINNYN